MFTSIRRSAIALGAALTLLVVLFLLALGGGVSAPTETALAGAPSTPTPCLTPGKVPLPTAIGGGCGTPFPTVTPFPDLCLGCSMSLEIVAVNGVPLAQPCSSDSGTVANPTKCGLAKGDTFTLHIVASSLPAIGNYGAFQTFLGYDTLLYKPASSASENHWPDGVISLRSPAVPNGTEGTVLHADPGTLDPMIPLPLSTYTDELIELEMNCQSQSPAAGNAHTIALLPFVGRDDTGTGFQFGQNESGDSVSEFFLGNAGSHYVGGLIDELLFVVPVPILGSKPLDLSGDGQLDRFRIPKPTPTFDFSNPSVTTTPEFNVGDVIDYPIHALLEVNCDTPSAPTVTPQPPVGGIGLDVDPNALPLESSQPSTGGRLLPPAALATMTLAVIVLTGAAWCARGLWRRVNSL